METLLLVSRGLASQEHKMSYWGMDLRFKSVLQRNILSAVRLKEKGWIEVKIAVIDSLNSISITI